MIFSRFEVKGSSMQPNFNSGDRVFVSKFGKIMENDIIVLNKDNKNMIKRVKKILNNKYHVLGDNQNESTDSRHFGLIEKKNIKGKVLFKY